MPACADIRIVKKGEIKIPPFLTDILQTLE